MYVNMLLYLLSQMEKLYYKSNNDYNQTSTTYYAFSSQNIIEKKTSDIGFRFVFETRGSSLTSEMNMTK